MAQIKIVGIIYNVMTGEEAPIYHIDHIFVRSTVNVRIYTISKLLFLVQRNSNEVVANKIWAWKKSR